MQKVEGSSPFIRFQKKVLAPGLFFAHDATQLRTNAFG
jgi:hypothetical protein